MPTCSRTGQSRVCRSAKTATTKAATTTGHRHRVRDARTESFSVPSAPINERSADFGDSANIRNAYARSTCRSPICRGQSAALSGALCTNAAVRAVAQNTERS
jgi:hypothetical protein